jgi:hypothetical protein
MSRTLASIAAAAALAAAAAACTAQTPGGPTAPPTAATTPASASASATATGAGPGALPTPNHTLTPGAVATTDVTRLCPHVDPALERMRPSPADKAKVYAAYGLSYPQPHGMYELDHLIPIELGGAPNDPANEWPERNDHVDPGLVARYHLSPAYVMNSKDIVEDVLHDDVCHGSVPLTTAQQEIATDWPAALRWYVIQGHTTPEPARG